MARSQKNAVGDQGSATERPNAHRKSRGILLRNNYEESPDGRIAVLQVNGVVPASLRRE